MKISSLAFEDQQSIPPQYTCDGANINPPLSFEDIPQEAQSLALIMHDPDAPVGDFTHWLIWNINPGIEEIDEGKVPEGVIQGMTDFNTSAYGGPCPPSGTHHYFFELYALAAARLPLTETATRTELERAMDDFVVEKAMLVGTYQR
jgi:Raf kinase inhibitor-like YbhB/YbcL family protein